MAKLSKKAPPPILNEKITPDQVEAIIRQELKDRTKNYLDAPDNYLSDEADFLEQDIEQWRRGLKNAEEGHLRIFHSFENPSIFRQERDVFRLRIKVAEERLADLRNGKADTSISSKLAGEVEGLFQPKAIPLFKEMENRLLERGYIDAGGSWQKSAPLLVELILELKEKAYLRNRTKLIACRDFFMVRYQKDIKDRFQPSRRPTEVSSEVKKLVPKLG